MKANFLGRYFVAMLLAGAGIAGASSHGQPPAEPRTDADLTRAVRHEILMYPKYSLWDDLGFRVSNGQVLLTGEVSQPFKRSDVERLVRNIPGVVGVSDEIKVLPLSPADDRLRMQVARAIFRDPALSRYSQGAVPSIHIIVDNGHVTLAGVVATEMDKNIASIRANGAGLSFGTVTNNLQVEHPAKKS
ncbi:MAG TPA: BON domain-containing protein [Bryobacteraceae bacterium]|nr:BON domain-containing protein [Bryobacteraceae bacterium]